MNSTGILLKEIETMTDEAVAKVLDFAMFIKSNNKPEQSRQKIAIKDAFGIFKGINTNFEREEYDRI